MSKRLKLSVAILVGVITFVINIQLLAAMSLEAEGNFSNTMPFPLTISSNSNITQLLGTELQQDLACLFLFEELDDGFRLTRGCVSPNAVRSSTLQIFSGTLVSLIHRAFDEQDNVVYRASIDLQRDNNRRVVSYEGEVTGDGFTDYHETVMNRYDDQNNLIEADVTKVLTGTEEARQLTVLEFCEDGGYWVWTNNEVIPMGNCNTPPPLPPINSIYLPIIMK